MVRHLRPLRVHQTASRMLETGRLAEEPPWYRVLAAIPPSTTLVRTLPVQLSDRKASRSFRKAPGLFKPQKIVYEEDGMRKQFFQDHPWELARPRIVLENDGNDHARYDWSRIKQPGKQLDGESVIQRQKWLQQNGLPRPEAYDKARKEFYDLRMQEDIERRVAAEEALAVGALFGKTYLDIGIEMEDRVLEDWRKKAIIDIQLKRHRQAAAYSSSVETESEPTATGEVVAEGAAGGPAVGGAA